MASRAAEARAADPRAADPRLAEARAASAQAAARDAQPPAQGSGQGGQPAGRFGINSLINRMTGNAAPAVEAQPAPRPQARPLAEGQPDPEQDRADIPAFLRRQAN